METKIKVCKKNYSSIKDRPAEMGNYKGYKGKGVYTINGEKYYVRAGRSYDYFATPMSRVTKQLEYKGVLESC